MNAFEVYLESIGYVPHEYDFKKSEWFPVVRRTSYSTMGPIGYLYKKDGAADIGYGLHEHGHPPCLIHPRPRIAGIVPGYENFSDALMSRVEQGISADELYQAIISRKPVAVDLQGFEHMMVANNQHSALAN